MSWKRRLVEAFPGPLESAMRSAYKYVHASIPIPYRYGKEFRGMYAFLQESQWWSREELEEYQMRQLEKLLRHAYENVPYYRRVFDERGLNPGDIQDFDDFRKLPYLTKDIVRENLEDMIARNIPADEMQYVTTGGSTGIPLGFYIEKRTNSIRMAFEWREFNWMGYSFGDRCVVLRGNVVEREENRQKAWWEYDRANNYIILSSYDMTEENLFKYVEKIEEFRPKVIRAYPSAIDILARFVREKGLRINERGYLKAISTSSETLYPTQRQMIEEGFGCPVFDKYGNSEQVTILGECERHEGYHDFMEYSYTEIIDEDGAPVTREGEVGEIVGTAFTNYAVPLIRYKPQDLVVYTNRECGCGRKLCLIKRIEGRSQELIVTKDGRLVTMTAFLFARHLHAFGDIKQLQFVQEEKGKLLLKLVKVADAHLNKQEIVDELKESTGDQVDITVEFVNEIPRTERGKQAFLVQNLPIKFWANPG